MSEPLNIPRHVAIIMDGNGRWAKAQGKPRSYGHYAGTQKVKEIAVAASDAGVKYLTMYAFSTENWIRPKEEVSYLMDLPAVFFERYMKVLMEKNIRVEMIGEISALPEKTQKVLKNAFEGTSKNTGMVLIFALNYGGRREIELAVQNIVKDRIEADKIDEKLIASYLQGGKYPDVDLLIRTSGEVRLSNFLLWEVAYAEMVFQNMPWPEYTEKDLFEAFEVYNGRQRRYGGVVK